MFVAPAAANHVSSYCEQLSSGRGPIGEPVALDGTGRRVPLGRQRGSGGIEDLEVPGRRRGHCGVRKRIPVRWREKRLAEEW